MACLLETAGGLNFFYSSQPFLNNPSLAATLSVHRFFRCEHHGVFPFDHEIRDGQCAESFPIQRLCESCGNHACTHKYNR